MKALVLSGGSIKSAFQGSAIRWVLEQGFEPDLICRELDPSNMVKSLILLFDRRMKFVSWPDEGRKENPHDAFPF